MLGGGGREGATVVFVTPFIEEIDANPEPTQFTA